jgi:hypothetical protein
VLLVQRWILARLRNRRFFSLAELNQAIGLLLVDLNQRPFKKLPGCRRSAFEALDAPALRPLPASASSRSAGRRAKVNIDYHVEFEGHYYSVPHRLVGRRWSCASPPSWWSAFLVEPARGRPRPQRRARPAHHGVAEHMPASHRAHLQWTPAKLIAWGRAHRCEHRRGGDLAARAPPASRAGLPRLPGVCWRLARQYTPDGWRPPAPGRWRSARPPTAA